MAQDIRPSLTGSHFDVVVCYLAASMDLEFPDREVGMSLTAAALP